MKKLALVMVLILISGCASRTHLKSLTDNELYNFKLKSESTKRKYKQELISRHPEWDETIAASVLAGKIEIGMTEDQVLATIGKPAEILGREPTSSDKHSLWVYRLKQLQFDDGKLSVIYNKKP